MVREAKHLRGGRKEFSGSMGLLGGKPEKRLSRGPGRPEPKEDGHFPPEK